MQKNNKKFLFITISILISICAIITIMLGISSQKINTYEFYLNDYDNEDKFIINDIYIGNTVYNLHNFNNKILKYDENKKWLGIDENIEDKTKILKIKISSLDNLKVSFLNNNKSKYKVIVKKNNNDYQDIVVKNKNGEYYFYDQISTISTLSDYVTALSVKSIFIYIFLFVILNFITYFIIRYINEFIELISNNEFSIKKFILSIILLFILNMFYIYVLMQFIGYFSIVPMLGSLILILLYMHKKNKADISKYFAIIFMFIGITFMYIFPPLHVPDESSHFIKSYQTSFVFQDNHETQDLNGKKGYVYLSKDFKKFIIKYGSQTANFGYRLQPRTYLYDLFKITDYSDLSSETEWYGTKFSSPVPYVPGAIVSLLARMLNMPILLLYMFGKLFAFIISALMCYSAIKITPHFKKIFFIIPLLPIFFQQTMGYGMDWLTNSTFILLFSMFLREIYSTDKIEKKNIIKIIILLILLGFCKFGYFAVALLVLLISKDKIKDNTKFGEILKKILIIAIPVLISIIVNLITRKLAYVANDSSSRDCISISTMITDPIRILSMVIETFKIRLDLDFFRGMVDGFGWSTVWSNDLFLFISLSLLLLIIFCKDENNKKLTLKQFVLISAIFVIICAIVYGSMLFGWTTTDWKSIDGLQPRYFIPAILPLYILLQSDFITVKFKNKKMLYSIILVIINTLSFITIISGFYL